jgi:hypothetical protein
MNNISPHCECLSIFITHNTNHKTKQTPTYAKLGSFLQFIQEHKSCVEHSKQLMLYSAH